MQLFFNLFLQLDFVVFSRMRGTGIGSVIFIASTLSLKNRNQTKIRSIRSELNATDGLNAVVFSLDDIVNGILDERLTAVEVKMALQRVLLMRCLSDFSPNLSPKNKCTTVEHEKTIYDRQENVIRLDDCSDATRPDEVFEAIASPDDINEGDSNLMVSDECVLQQSRELMQELRLVLVDRASEFDERERRALAAFYGAVDSVSHQTASMARSEEVLQQEELPLDELPELRRNEGIASASHDRQETPSRQLPSDLLVALHMRSVVEQTIGDE
ncbi:unnamed protein product [Angiostrongylus costaricensis]|uniref:Uncharacterized protein n=1 Tax=Angiostrongylus costaricensis TaxID=334426 RepID=A0A158PG23_ANGCS|nr:unnamed protein product [Angiostrongylus costaricensis]